VDTPTVPAQRGATPEPDGGADRTPTIVVGVDGSDGCRPALAWAFEAAARRGAELQVRSAFPVETFWLDPQPMDTDHVARIRADTEARAREVVEEVRHDLPGTPTGAVRVHVVAVAGPAAQRLVEATGTADLLVVGSRGRGGVSSTLLGSVALHCSTHAECPVVVVHPARQHAVAAVPGRPRVVVGLDDPAHAAGPLLRAAEEAAGLAALLEVVLAYEAPNYWSDLYALMAPPLGETHQQAFQRGSALVADVLGPEGLERGDVRVVAVRGRAGEVLVQEAEGAALLVVGSRSRSRLEGMLLGSVALHCVVHAPCPAMVVRPEPAPATAGTAQAAAAAAPR